MAKSLRSKWKRKMRDVKTDRYAKKELVKLKECAERLKKTKESCLSPADFAKSGLFTDSVAKKEGATTQGMEVETNDATVKSSFKTSKSFGKTDKNGQYPVWMSQRNVKRIQKKNGKKKQLKQKNKTQK